MAFRFVLIILTTILIVLVTPIFFVLLLLPSIIIRFIVSVLAKIFKKDLGPLLPALSSIFTIDSIEDRPETNIGGALVLDAVTSTTRLRETIQLNLIEPKVKNKPLHPEIQHHFVPWMGFTFGRFDKNFNINDHVIEDKRRIEISDLGDITTTILDDSWVKGRSPWKLVHFPNFVDENDQRKSAIILSSHHGIADGEALVKTFFKAIFGSESSIAVKLPKQSLANQMMTLPYEMASDFVTSYDSNELHPLKLVSKRRHSWFCPERIPLSLLEDISNRHGVSVTAVILTVIGGALRNFYRTTNRKVPKHIHLLQPTFLERDEYKFKNYSTHMFLRVFTGEDNILKRLKLTEDDLKKTQSSVMVNINLLGLYLFGLLPRFLQSQLFTIWQATGIYVEDIFHDQSKVKFDGNPLMRYHCYGGPLTGNPVVFFYIGGYNEGIDIQVAASKTVSNESNVIQLGKVIVEEIRILSNI